MTAPFAAVTLDDEKTYNEFLARCPQKASDYSFVNLWGWRDQYGLERILLPDCILIRQQHPTPAYWGPVGHWPTIDWDRVRSTVQSDCRFIRVPETLARTMVEACPHVQMHEHRDHWDYLYSVQELTTLSGNRFHKKKNLLNQFLRRYEYTYVRLDKHNVEKALTLQTEWMLWRNDESDSTLEAENKAIVRVMHDWERLDAVFGAGLEVEGRMVAYTIAEPLSSDTVVIHFEKGCPNYKGVYQAINNLFLANDCRDFTWVNREQDLGDQGLRKAKLSYNPSDYLKKFELVMP
jgi:hypothetical protein